MVEKRINRYRRYVKYMFQWLFCEKIRGLDFTMRDKSLIEKSGGVLHGYAKTDDKHCIDILQSLNITPDDSIIDIGCGKGNVLRIAYKYPFKRIKGIDLDERLVRIAKKNFNILKMNDRISVSAGDAVKYKKYYEYNILYLANPFGRDIMEKVIKRIVGSKKGKIRIVYYNPTCAEVIEKYGGVKKKVLFDKSKSYYTYIYEL